MQHLAAGGWVFGAVVTVYGLFEVAMVNNQWAVFATSVGWYFRQILIVVAIWFVCMLLLAPRRIRRDRIRKWTEEAQNREAIGLLKSIDNRLSHQVLTSKREPSIYFDLKNSFSLPTMNESPEINVLTLSEVVDGAHAGQLGKFYHKNPTSERWNPTGMGIRDTCFKCRVINDGSTPMFNLAFDLTFIFSEAIAIPNGITCSATGIPGKCPICIQRLDPGESSAFVFYVVSQSSKFSTLQFPELAVTELEDGTPVELKFRYPAVATQTLSPWIPDSAVSEIISHFEPKPTVGQELEYKDESRWVVSEIEQDGVTMHFHLVGDQNTVRSEVFSATIFWLSWKTA